MTTQKNETPFERMQKAGLTVDQLREIVGGVDRPDFIKRARAAGLTMAELKDIVHKSSDTNTGSGSISTHVTPIGNVSPAGGIAPQD